MWVSPVVEELAFARVEWKVQLRVAEMVAQLVGKRADCWVLGWVERSGDQMVSLLVEWMVEH